MMGNRCLTRKLNSGKQEVAMGRGILLWMLGIPLPIILLLAFFR
jgi:hypothetical protein